MRLPTFSARPAGLLAAAALFLSAVFAAGPAGAAYNIYWGDLHAHTSYSDDAYIIQANLGRTPQTPRYALDYAKAILDFAALTDHAEHIEYYRDQNGDLITDGSGDPIDEWADLIAQCNDSAANGPLVVFPAFEFTRTGADEYGDDLVGGGHKQVIFKDFNLPAGPISAVDGQPVEGASYADGPADLWSQLDAGGYDYITIPHHPAKGVSSPLSPETDMSTDWDYVNALRQPVVEIFSVHGSSDHAGCPDEVGDGREGGFRSERSVESALNLWLSTGRPGYKLGIVGSTDTHLSTPGAVAESTENMVHQEGDYTGGLTAVLAEAQTREAIWEALINRRVYATSGPRILLGEFTISALGRTYQMGETITAPAGRPLELVINLSVETDTADLYSIVITRSTQADPAVGGVNTGGQPWVEQTEGDHSLCAVWDGAAASCTVPDTLTGGRAYYRVTVFQKPTLRYTWNGVAYLPTLTQERAWSSPIFIQFAAPVSDFLDLLLSPSGT